MEKNEIVKKPDELIKMRGTFTESELKLSTYLIAILEHKKYVYKISIRNYLEKFDKNIGDFEKLYYTALGLTRKQFKIIDRINKRFAIYNFFSRATYENGILTIKFDDELHNYLMLIKDNYLKYNIKYIMILNSKYSIRLYEILKNKFEKTKKFQKTIKLNLSVDEIRELLAIPTSYKYNMFKKRILEKAKEELQNKTDIMFEYKEIRQGKKIVEIEFTIKQNSNVKNNDKNKQTDNRIQQQQTEQKEQQHIKKQVKKETQNDFKAWKAELIKKGNIIIQLNDKNFELKTGFLFENGKLLNREKAFDAWSELYEHKDQIKIIEDKKQFETEQEENRKEQLEQELLKMYFGKRYEQYTKNALGGDEILYYEILKIEDITFKDDGTIDIITFIGEGEDGKYYRLKATLNQLKQYTK